MSVPTRQSFGFLVALTVVVAGCLVGERPVLPDADGDDLPDEVERQGWNVTVYYDPVPCDDPTFVRTPVVYHVTSNVFLEDADEDGLIDSLEFAFGTDPNKADTDGDGLTDKEEWDMRQDRERFFQRSRISGTDVDSDQDCLRDDEEVLIGWEIPELGRRVFSDPTSEDGDRDGWLDRDEIFIYKTDPLDPDTDGDGVRDPLDVDPHRDVALYLIFEAVRIDAETGPRAGFLGSVGGRTFDAGDGFPVARGQWSDIPVGVSPGYLDIDDVGPDQTVDLSISWTRLDAQGRLERGYDFGPSPNTTQAWIRIRSPADAWAFMRADGSYGPDGNVCTFEGPDGAFRFDLRIGTAGEDPATYASLCV